ncbi:hypothetical protein J7J62_03850 [bacterium]|nr:hypothetical protein [bacterium]
MNRIIVRSEELMPKKISDKELICYASIKNSEIEVWKDHNTVNITTDMDEVQRRLIPEFRTSNNENLNINKIIIYPNARYKIELGIKCQIDDENYLMYLRLLDSLAMQYGLIQITNALVKNDIWLKIGFHSSSKFTLNHKRQLALLKFYPKIPRDLKFIVNS